MSQKFVSVARTEGTRIKGHGTIGSRLGKNATGKLLDALARS